MKLSLDVSWRKLNTWCTSKKKQKKAHTKKSKEKLAPRSTDIRNLFRNHVQNVSQELNIWWLRCSKPLMILTLKLDIASACIMSRKKFKNKKNLISPVTKIWKFCETFGNMRQPYHLSIFWFSMLFSTLLNLSNLWWLNYKHTRRTKYL